MGSEERGSSADEQDQDNSEPGLTIHVLLIRDWALAFIAHARENRLAAYYVMSLRNKGVFYTPGRKRLEEGKTDRHSIL